MNQWKTFTNSLPFVITFLVLTLFIEMIWGERIATIFLWLVMADMIIVNADTFATWLGGKTNGKQNYGYF